MRSVRLLFISAVVALAVPFSSVAPRAQAQPRNADPRFVPDELIVKYRPGAGERGKAQARARIGAVAVRNLAKTPSAAAAGAVELVRVPAGTGVQRAMAALSGTAAVEYVEPNWIYTHAARPNDPSFQQQWALENAGQAIAGDGGGTVDADIDAPEAWHYAPGAPAVVVGVIDEGIDIAHEDLGIQPGGAIWTNPYETVDGRDNDGNGYIDDVHGWDFAAGDNTVYDGSAAALDVDSHGTHVAGTIGAKWGNARGVAGVSPGVVIIPAKFLGVSGGTTAGAIEAVDYFTDLKVRHNLNIVATNNSWGGGGYSQALLEAIARAAAHDILFIVAAGNGGSDGIADDNDAVASYPSGYNTAALAGYDSIISVTATGRNDELPSWANFGARTVDLGAPGVLIASTTPQNTYRYSTGTSMAAPHVTAAAALVHAARGLTGAALKSALLQSVDAIASLTGKTVTRGRLNLARGVTPASTGTDPGTAPVGPAEIVLHASRATTVAGNWTVQADATAAGGARMQSVNLGVAKVAPALPSPAHYFEMTFAAEAGKPYRLWLRAKAEGNSWANDSVHVQFSGSVNVTGSPIYRIDSTSSAEVNLEDCSGCGVSGWGWQDNGYGAAVLGPVIYFAASGSQRVRVQIREDGVAIDQIVLSSAKYLSTAPGALKNDSTTLAAGDNPSTPPPATAPGRDEIVLYAGEASTIAGRWMRVADASGAGEWRMQNANGSMPKVATALSSPTDYFELTFNADAGKLYRLWIRGKADSNYWGNDSVHVQFSTSVNAAGAPAYRIGSSSAAEVNLEECSSCGVAGWGWQDNGYGAGVLGPEIRFATSGAQTVRIQVREDGLGIDQVVLSAAAYLTAAPGMLKNDTTILPRSGD